MDTQKISIVIPCYNAEQFIENTLQSLYAQTHTELEIILVDDGSTDGSKALIEALAASEPRIVPVYKENGGVTSARLAGVAKASGEWIGFVDSDDQIEPTMYERLLYNAQAYQADISHCGYQMVFPSRVDYYYNTGRLVEQDRITALYDLIEGKFVEPGLCNKLFRRRLFDSVLRDDVMDTSIRNFEDLLMNFYLFKNAEKAVYEDICPYHYMVRNGSAATSALNEHKLIDPLKVTQIIEREAAELPALHTVISRKLIDRLVALSTMVNKAQKAMIRPHQRAARKTLRASLPKYWSALTGAQKVKALWAAIWPFSYGLVHRCYAVARGYDKKYEVR